MSKPAGNGFPAGYITIGIVEETHNNFEMTITDANQISYTKKEKNYKIGLLFDLFMFFASLEIISISDIEKNGFRSI
jgi:hypothetical protein